MEFFLAAVFVRRQQRWQPTGLPATVGLAALCAGAALLNAGAWRTALKCAEPMASKKRRGFLNSRL